MMKSAHFFEFQSIVQYLMDELTGSQLQEVMTTQEGIVLGFYRFQTQKAHQPKSVWLVMDLDTQFPFIGLFDHNPWHGLKSAKPLGLFVTSHLKNHNVCQIEHLENQGRVARIYFSSEKNLYLEVRLIPKQPNLLAVADAKSISWDKVKPLDGAGNENFLNSDVESRSVPFMFSQWLARRSKTSSKSTASKSAGASQNISAYEKWVKQKEKDLEKKRKALKSLEEQIQNPLIEVYAQIGEHLKVQGFKNLPLEFSRYIDFEKKVSWNIEKSFEKSKQLKSKSEGAQERKTKLLKEMENLEDTSERKFSEVLKNQADLKSKRTQRKPSQTQMRKLVLDESKDLVCWMGKSAVENAKLLRESKAWDIWIHLKDYPSAYAILQRNKDQNVSDLMVQKAAQWLASESLKNKKDLSGIKIAIVWVECRHVRPIKGDKLGRVTYHHAHEILITL